MRAHFLLVLLVASGCKTTDPLYCDEDTPCTDPDRPYCDLTGEYPASDGHGRTCIANPFDGGVGADGGGDSADPDAAGPRHIVQLATGTFRTCAVFNDGGLRCWGSGVLGYGQEEVVGDDEAPYMKGDVPAGGRVAEVGLGVTYICVRYDAGNVRCWGNNSDGELGYGNTDPLGYEGETPDMLDDVDLGAKALQISVAYEHACALLEGNIVRCWGRNNAGQAGYGHDENVGDTETPASQDPVELGGVPIQVTTGYGHSCALLEGGRVQCWGSALYGALGYGSPDNVGATNDPADAGDVIIGGTVERIFGGRYRTCALLDDKDVRCWGQLDGIGHPEINEHHGDDEGETPAAAGDVSIGGEVEELTSGVLTCAKLTSGSVRCWSSVSYNGYGDSQPVGDDETPATAGNVAVGGDVELLSTATDGQHVCVLLTSGAVRCWGANTMYQLGLGHTENIGDNETPNSEDPVQVLDPAGE